jgi:hypothetical protein
VSLQRTVTRWRERSGDEGHDLAVFPADQLRRIAHEYGVAASAGNARGSDDELNPGRTGE